MNIDADWLAMIRAWQQDPAATEGPDPLGIRERVLADSRRMSLAMLTDHAVGLAIVGFAAWQLATRKGLDTFVWGFAVLAFTGLALQVTSDARKGLWRPAAESTRAYLDLALERIARREWLVRFAWLLYAIEVAFLVAWYPLTWFFWPTQTWSLLERTPWLLAALAIATFVLVGWSVSSGQRNRAERREFERMRQELDGPA